MKTFQAMNYRNSAFFFLIEASTIEHIKSETTVTHDVINITNQTILGIFFLFFFFRYFKFCLKIENLLLHFTKLKHNQKIPPKQLQQQKQSKEIDFL